MSGTIPTDKAKGLTDSEEQFRALVTATSDVVYRMSPHWTVMRQLQSSGFLSSTSEPINDWLTRYIHPVDQDRIKQAIDQAISTKSTFQLEHRVLQADGTVGWAASRAVPILDGDGDILEWFGAANDITPRKLMEDALKYARNEAGHLRTLNEVVTSNTPDLVYVFNLDYKFTFANPALLKMWGKTWDEAVGKGLLENGYEPWHAEMHEREIDHVVATKEAIRGEVAFPHATLGRRVYDYIFSPVLNARGEVEAIAGTTRDISDIKENELRKNAFISMVSHELKTPLTSVISYVQVACKRAVQNDDPVATDMLERAGKQLGKMTNMINGFLNVSRLESGTIQIDQEPFDLSLLMKEVEEETQAITPSHIIAFAPVKAVWVNADREKMGQVFNNLLSNAIKYSPTGSEVYVTCQTKGNRVQVSIHDEGIGITAENLPLLFNRYYRVNDAETTHISGFGIGLYLCSEIIKRHGGEIWAESELGKGSTFYFSLPAIAKP